MAKRKLPKKPKKPKASATLKSWEAYDQRYKDWEKKCSDIKKGFTKKESLVKKYAHK